jgi:hypothetical protein
MFSLLAAKMAVRRRGLESGSPPPFLAAILISFILNGRTWFDLVFKDLGWRRIRL